ncbi:tetratricopeptide repeat protein [Spongiimicrobium salis]|uniref:tetratricopeptide repeat protein n=1 Tax=Spongiimicrobium salis TaxID=1667022 RepID=UPI00374D4C74
MSKDFIHIDRYLDGEMDAAEAQTFETKIAADADLAAEVKLQKEMRALYSEKDWVDKTATLSESEAVEAYTRFFRSEEANTLRNTIKKVVEEEKKPKNNKMRFLGVAAALLLLCGLSFVFFWNSTPDYDALYTQYLDKENITSVVSRGSEDNDLVKGQLLFDKGDYEAAITTFLQYHNQAERIHPTSYIYLGISYLESGQYAKALATFKKLKASNTLESVKADWFSAMVYLKQGDKEQLIGILKTITSDEGNYNFGKAQSLLDRLD